MTALRPERDAARGDAGAFEAAAAEPHDPLNDPLPGQQSRSPWFSPRAGSEPSTGEPAAYGGAGGDAGGGYGAGSERDDMFAAGSGRQGQWAGTGQGTAADPYAPAVDPYGTRTGAAGGLPGIEPEPGPGPQEEPKPPTLDDETVALRVARPAASPVRPVGGPEGGGRAARRRAAQQAARRRGGHRARGRRAAGRGSRAAAGAGTAAGAVADAVPRSRVEARRLARAAKEPPGVIASRLIGEAFITLGVVMLLFVAYQLWWSNVLAGQEAGGAANDLQRQWDKGGARDPGVFSAGQGFAIIYIPKLDVKAPIAEGIDKHSVLDRGMVGHYGQGRLKTAMPWDKQGNFALAGHRNTHGEPFRYINRLKRGDEIVVETRKTFYTYKMVSILPQTSPSNVSVLKPVPPGSGFTKPGRYITLTTCTPEFTSTYRMIVWGKMVDERPRSEGKPDALVGS